MKTRYSGVRLLLVLQLMFCGAVTTRAASLFKESPVVAAAPVAAGEWPRERLANLDTTWFGQATAAPAAPASQPELVLNLFSDFVVTAVVDRVESPGAGREVYTGHLKGAAGGQFQLARMGDVVAALVEISGRTPVAVTYAGGQLHRIADVDTSETASCGGTPNVPFALPSLGGNTLALPAAASNSPLDILVVYTPGAVNQVGDESGLRTLLDLSVAQFNSAFTNSALPYKTRIVQTRQVSYEETDDIFTDLNRVTTPGDGFMDEVHAWRDQCAADIVCLMTRSDTYGFAGVAHFFDPSNPTNGLNGFCLTTVYSSFGNKTFTHEIGHNMGCGHGGSDGGGIYSFANGYRFTAAQDGILYRTVMAYYPGERIAQFSNPFVNYRGTATGVANASDNARCIGLTFAAVSSYRVGIDSDNDGMPNVWEQQFGLNPNLASDASANPDRDWYTNLEEFQTGRNPNVWDEPYKLLRNVDLLEVTNQPALVLIGHNTWMWEGGVTNAGAQLFEFQTWAIRNTERYDQRFGDDNQTDYDIPLSGFADQDYYSPPHYILATGPIAARLRVTLNDQSMSYSIANASANADADADGMPGYWEVAFGLNDASAADAALDADADGMTNLREYQRWTNPRRTETDGDGMPDGWEETNQLNPGSSADASSDADADGLSNYLEYKYGANPRNVDSDGDGMRDGWEHENRLNPMLASDAGLDLDGDGVSNYQEFVRGLNARFGDTDYDGISDATDANPAQADYSVVAATPTMNTLFRYDDQGGWISVEPGDASWGDWIYGYNRNVRGVGEFALTGVPTNARIKAVTLVYNMGTLSNDTHAAVKIVPVDRAVSSDAATASNIFNQITSGAALQVLPASFPLSGGRDEFVALNAAAVISDIQSRVSSGIWRIGFHNATPSNGPRVYLRGVRMYVAYETGKASSYNSMTVAGTFNGWNQAANNMSLVSNYVWQWQATFTNAVAPRFKFVANSSWGINWGEQNQSDFDVPVNGTAEQGNYADITLNHTLNGTYRFTFNEQTRSYTVATVVVDTDADGLPDPWELQYFGNLAQGPAGDPDGDGKSNLTEYLAGWDPTVPNYFSNYSSMTVAGTFNGWNAALNNMRIVSDYTWQYDISLTNASNTRFKFVANGSWAVNWGEQNQSDFQLPITDQYAESGNADILINGMMTTTLRFSFNEQTRAYTVSILSTDSDNDGMPDPWETLYKLNPTNSADAAYDGDADLLSNLAEYGKGTHPWHADTDFDGINDTTDTSPLYPNWNQVTLSPSVLGTVSRYGGFDVPSYTYSFVTNHLYYYTGYRDYSAERGYLRFDMSALNGARIRNVVLLYDGLSLYSGQAMSYTIAPLATQDPRNAPSNTFLAIDATTNRQSASSLLPANSGIKQATRLSDSLQSALANRPSSDYWALSVFNDQNSYNGVGWSMSNVALVVTYEPLQSGYSSMTVAGTFNGWNQTLKNMQLVSDYTWQWDAELSNATGVRFKFVANQTWSINWGEQNQGDFDLPVTGQYAEGGNADILVNGTLNGTYRFTFNEQTRAYTVTRIGGSFVSNYSSMSIAGSFNGWNAAANNMALVADYIWEGTIAVNASNPEFKFTANGNWGTNWGESDQSDFTIPMMTGAEQGAGNIRVTGNVNANIKFSFNEQTRTYIVTQP